MRRLQRVGDLPHDAERFFDWQRPVCDSFSERRAVHQFQHQRFYAVEFFDAMDRCDMRMIERRQDARFTFKAGQAIRVRCEDTRQHLDRDVASQLRVARAIDFAHSSYPEEVRDAIGPELAADDGRTEVLTQ